jgi:hypothetical protein
MFALPRLRHSSPETVVHVTAQRFPLDTFKNHSGTAQELQTACVAIPKGRICLAP